MTIKIYTENDFAQGSGEWAKMRNSCLTSSELSKVITPKTLKPSSQIRDLVKSKIVKDITGEYLDDFMTYDMERGLELEPLARNAYIEHMKLDESDVKQVSFVKRETPAGIMGASTDGLIKEDGVLEIKCRKDINHFSDLVYGNGDRSYQLQIQGELFVTQRDYCDLVLYHPEIPSEIIRCERDLNYEELFLEVVSIFYKLRKEIEESYKNIFKQDRNLIMPKEVIKI